MPTRPTAALMLRLLVLLCLLTLPVSSQESELKTLPEGQLRDGRLYFEDGSVASPKGFTWGLQEGPDVVEYVGVRATAGNLRERVYHVMLLKGREWNREALKEYAKGDEAKGLKISQRGQNLQALYTTRYGGTGVLAVARADGALVLEYDASSFKQVDFEQWVDSYRAEKYTPGKAAPALAPTGPQSGQLSLELGTLELPSGYEWRVKEIPQGKIHVGSKMGEESLEALYLIGEMKEPLQVSESSAREYLEGMLESQGLKHNIVSSTAQTVPFRKSRRIEFEVLSDSGQKSPGVLVLTSRLAITGFGNSFKPAELDAMVASFKPAPGAELEPSRAALGTALLLFLQGALMTLLLGVGLVVNKLRGSGWQMPWLGTRNVLLVAELAVLALFLSRTPESLTPFEAGERAGEFMASLMISSAPLLLGLTWLGRKRSPG